jgi:uncharacterized membrane protein
MNFISKVFFRGLIAVLPITLTIYIVYWLGRSSEALLEKAIKLVIPESQYVQGMGLLASLLFIFGVGLLLHAWIVKKFFRWGDQLMDRIPVVKTLHGSIQDFLKYFSPAYRQKFNRVVLVRLNPETQLLGVVTREDFSQLPKGLNLQETVAVYVPMGYQIGGFTVLIPSRSVTPVDMSVEEAMRFSLTAGMSTQTISTDPKSPD